MIDPMTVGLAIQGVRLVVNAVKSAADEAREAVDAINECVDSGKKLGDSLSPVKKFFRAASKYEENRSQLEDAKKAQDEAIANGEPVDDPITDAEYVMDMMAADREIKQYYDQIKHHMIYKYCIKEIIFSKKNDPSTCKFFRTKGPGPTFWSA